MSQTFAGLWCTYHGRVEDDSLDAAMVEVNAARPGWEFGGCWQSTAFAWVAQAVKWNFVEHADFETWDGPVSESLVAALRSLAADLRDTE